MNLLGTLGPGMYRKLVSGICGPSGPRSKPSMDPGSGIYRDLANELSVGQAVCKYIANLSLATAKYHAAPTLPLPTFPSISAAEDVVVMSPAAPPSHDTMMVWSKMTTRVFVPCAGTRTEGGRCPGD